MFSYNIFYILLLTAALIILIISFTKYKNFSLKPKNSNFTVKTNFFIAPKNNFIIVQWHDHEYLVFNGNTTIIVDKKLISQGLNDIS